ncbi:MAG: hypothetical protein CM15mP59_3120 [Flavobacteriaceae bacterium]|nr:MAG: hypothetical protein CM15mP59_3120 [Flavobacteriaceae bacterium]
MALQKKAEEIELIRESALVVSKTLGMLASEIKPGITTSLISMVLPNLLFVIMVQSLVFGYMIFPTPFALVPMNRWCMAFPKDKPLENGDIVSIDCGALKMVIMAIMPTLLRLVKSIRTCNNCSQ